MGQELFHVLGRQRDRVGDADVNAAVVVAAAGEGLLPRLGAHGLDAVPVGHLGHQLRRKMAEDGIHQVGGRGGRARR